MATADMTRSVPPASSWDLDGIAPEAFDEDRTRDNGFTAGDVFVAVAITLASVALTLALIVHTGTPVLAAVLTGGCVWIALLIGHSALRRVESRATAVRLDPHMEGADSSAAQAAGWDRQGVQASAAPVLDRRPKPAAGAGLAAPTLSPPNAPAKAAHVAAPAEPPLRSPKDAASVAARVEAGDAPGAAPLTVSGAGPRAAHAERGAASFGRRGGPPLTTTASPADDANWLEDLDLGDFRPKAQPELPGAPAMPPPGPRAPVGDAAARAGEEDIDTMLRRLAHDISRGRKRAASETAPPAGPAGSAASSAAGTPMVIGPVISPDGPAGGRRPVLPPSAPKAAVPGKPMPPPLPKAPPPAFPPNPARMAEPGRDGAGEPVRVETAAGRLAAIADALSDEQIEVFLETINGLDDCRARHYEVSVRLKLRDGQTLDNDKLIGETRGSGLLPLIEAVKVSSTRRIAVQMIRRGRSGDFFSLVDGEALDTRQFGKDMETIVGGDQALAERLVLAFSQADVRAFTNAQWDSLRDIAGLGFRFSVEEITDLDMDFEKLASNGFAFAKLDAECFLEGLPIENSRVPAADICRHLSGAGLALIVGNIRDETTRAKILGFGALFGQGTLFGAPRPVRSEVLRQREATGAAH